MSSRKAIWIDLDNTPHVPFFRPIINELEKRGETVCVTARDAFQVCDLADLLGVSYQGIGRHYGKNQFLKLWGLFWRSAQLLPYMLRQRPAIAVSHGSRSQILLCNLFRIPTVMIMDYEHARTPMLLRPRWEIVPDAIRHERLQCHIQEQILSYEGIKEDVYAHDFKPDDSLQATLGLKSNRIIVTVRPPANEAHYHSPESDELFYAFMKLACSRNDVQLILLPRNKKQESSLREAWPHCFSDRKIIIPEVAVDGLNLLWHSDLVVSGGGTMNREAAALGLPVYSIFKGPTGSVDRELERQQRLIMIQDVNELESRIVFQKRHLSSSQNSATGSPIATIIKHIDRIREQESILQPRTAPRGA